MAVTDSTNPFIPSAPPPPPPRNDEDWKNWAAALLISNHIQHEELRKGIMDIKKTLIEVNVERRLITWIATPFVAAIVAFLVGWFRN